MWLVLVLYLWHSFGVTIGLHRLLAHRSFKCYKAVEYFFVFAAYLAYHGSPLWWATIHRAHHRHVDTELDPHAPNQGVWHAYAFYRDFRYPAHIDPVKQSPDLLKDPVYRFLETPSKNWRRAYVMCVAIGILLRVMLYFLFGWQVALASVIASILALNMPLIVNIVCHTPSMGYRNYDTADDSVNVWWFGILALGDGWHNNHHANPGSTNMGLLKHEFDASWFVLKVLERLGLVWDINESIHAEAPKIASQIR